LKKAMERKIVVITHEASDIQNADYDVEAFDNKSYGEHLMEALAKLMNGEGEYAVYVGSLTSKTHNEWVDAAIALQKSKFPKMKLIADKIETNDDQQVAYAKTKELLRAHPNVKGFEGSASTDVAGIGLAVEEAGLEDKTAVVGTSLPSIAKKYLPTGAVDMISFWDPADAGYVSNKVAVMVLNGEKITDGLDLSVKGYNKVKLVNGNKIYGQAWTDVTKENLSQYDF
jgi:simple sugar transport system substrate-binding protein